MYPDPGPISGSGGSDGQRMSHRHGVPNMFTVQRPVPEPSYSHLYAPASHTHSTEMSTAMDEDHFATPMPPRSLRKNVASNDSAAAPGFDRTWHATPSHPTRPVQRGDPSTTQNQSQRSTNIGDTTDELGDLVVSKKLKDGVNAVVIEHQGHLQRVVLDTRTGVSEVERLQRLSRELASVSDAIAFASATKSRQKERSTPQYSVILDKMPTPPRPQNGIQQRAVRASSSIPELLSMINEAAGEIHLNNNSSSNSNSNDRDRPDQYVTHRRQDMAATVGRDSHSCTATRCTIRSSISPVLDSSLRIGRAWMTQSLWRISAWRLRRRCRWRRSRQLLEILIQAAGDRWVVQAPLPPHL